MDVAKTRHSEVFVGLLPVARPCFALFAAVSFTKNYALACFDPKEIVLSKSS